MRLAKKNFPRCVARYIYNIAELEKNKVNYDKVVAVIKGACKAQHLLPYYDITVFTLAGYWYGESYYHLITTSFKNACKDYQIQYLQGYRKLLGIEEKFSRRYSNIKNGFPDKGIYCPLNSEGDFVKEDYNNPRSFLS
jgi:hypothetical protein